MEICRQVFFALIFFPDSTPFSGSLWPRCNHSDFINILSLSSTSHGENRLSLINVINNGLLVGFYLTGITFLK